MIDEERRAFLDGYAFLLPDLQGAGGTGLARALGRWFYYVDSNPEAADVLATLEAKADMPAWLTALERTAGSISGSGTLGSVELPWSFDAPTYLAERIGLLRQFARGDLNLHDFVVRYMYERGGSNSPDGAAQRVVAKIAEPAFRELREWLRTRLAEPSSDFLCSKRASGTRCFSFDRLIANALLLERLGRMRAHNAADISNNLVGLTKRSLSVALARPSPRPRHRPDAS